MRLISHRGNLDGPNPTRENTPEYIDEAIAAGYEVEVDINYINGSFYLGHDTPDHKISEEWINNRKDKVWFHCKNLSAATMLKNIYYISWKKHMYFCHTSDAFVLTSTGHVWVHDLTMPLNSSCIIPLLGKYDVIDYTGVLDVYGVCTDYVKLAEKYLV